MLIFLHVLPSVLFGMEQTLDKVLYYSMEGQPPQLNIFLKQTNDTFGNTEVSIYDFFDPVDQVSVDAKNIYKVNDIHFIVLPGDKSKIPLHKKININDFITYVQIVQQSTLFNAPIGIGLEMAFTVALSKSLQSNALQLLDNAFVKALQLKWNTKILTQKDLKDKQKSLHSKHYVFYYQFSKNRFLVIKQNDSNEQTAFDEQDYNSVKSLIGENSCTLYHQDKTESYYVCEVNPNIYKNQNISKKVLKLEEVQGASEKLSFVNDARNFIHFRDAKIYQKLWYALPYWFQKQFLRPTFKLTPSATTRYVLYCIDEDGAKKIILYRGNNGLNDIDDSGYQKYIVQSGRIHGLATAYYIDQKGINYALCPVDCKIITEKSKNGQSLFEAIDLDVFKESLKKELFNNSFYNLMERDLSSNSVKVRFMLLDALQYVFNAFESNTVSNLKLVWPKAAGKNQRKSEGDKKQYLFYYVYEYKGKSHQKIVFSRHGRGNLNFFDQEQYARLKQYVKEDTCNSFFYDTTTQNNYCICEVGREIYDESLLVTVEDYTSFSDQNKREKMLNQSASLKSKLQKDSLGILLMQSLNNAFAKAKSQGATQANPNAKKISKDFFGIQKSQSETKTGQGQQPTQQNSIAYFFSLIWQWLASWWPF